MPDFDDTRRALTDRGEPDGYVEIDGAEYPIKVVEPTLKGLEDIEKEVEGNDETEAIRMMVDKYLKEPEEIDAGEMPISKLFDLFEAMRELWDGDGRFEAARNEMPVDSGKRQTSRR
jgi:hypothetical protein